MFIPPVHQENRRDILFETIRSKSFGTLITQGEKGIDLTHVPFTVKGETLFGHVARPNPQWQDAITDSEAVASFVIDDAYIHPGWYPSKAQHGRAVPTWNYIAVEARGAIEWFHDAAELQDMLQQLTADHENGRPSPWAIDDAPPRYIEAMIKAIVGFRMDVRDLKGSWKIDQHKDDIARLSVADGIARERPHSILPDKMRAL
ncbi:MAG: FMN-binding negative transcriptional regulator [Pseudomonadota bacterium]